MHTAPHSSAMELHHQTADLSRAMEVIFARALRVGTISYSLKEIEKLYFKKRDGAVGAGADSMAVFAEWLDQKDGEDHKTSKLLRSIQDYNEDDCLSTLELTAFLRARQKEEKIAYVPPPEREPNEELAGRLSLEVRALAVKLMDLIPEKEKAKEFPDRKSQFQVAEILSHCLEFHRREAKKKWWTFFERHDKSPEEYLNDSDTLAAVELVKTQNAGGQTLYLCRFDPEQDSTVKRNDTVIVVESKDAGDTFVVHSMSPKKGELVLEAAGGRRLPKGNFTLAEFLSIPTVSAIKALQRLGQGFKLDGKYFGLTKALVDLLLRNPPDIKGIAKGKPLTSEESELTVLIPDLALRLNNSTLGIQGPPGSGKTFTIALIILTLAEAGKRVAISSNSHKAIIKIFEELDKQSKARGKREFLNMAKITSQMSLKEENTEKLESLGVAEINSAADLQADDFNVVGATVYALCSPILNGFFTHLLVDEATQVSLSNLLAMGGSAENIVLVGDQAQLEQPIQGKHPGVSGKSALGYLSGEAVTFQPEAGIFLPVTRRMHPDVCKFISTTFYEGRLKHHPITEKRALIFPEGGLKHVRRTSGIFYAHTPHKEDRVAESEEEVQKILEITDELLKCEFVDADGSRRAMTLNDIVYVAPYNLQVENLKKALPPEARVGSVDLFQGQEAVVSILSMCVSDGERAPRGVSFVLNPHRMNVALSRAEVLSIVVGSPDLSHTRCNTLESMRLINTYCKIVSGFGIEEKE